MPANVWAGRNPVWVRSLGFSEHNFWVRTAISMSFVIALCLPLSAFAQLGKLAGTLQLSYVEPQDAENTSPTGVINQKLHFAEDGKLYALAPEQVTLDGVPTEYIVANGKLVVKPAGASRPIEFALTFTGADTMVMSRPHAAKRIFNRIKGVDVKLEPQSLQLIKATGTSEDSRYDTDDYGKLALPERLKGMWEVIAYEQMPRNQLPPYGFFNDLLKIDSLSVTTYRREPAAEDAVPFTFNDKLTSSGIGLGGQPGSTIDWTPSFNAWGQLVLDSQYCRVILKRTRAKATDVASFPIKVVLVRNSGK